MLAWCGGVWFVGVVLRVCVLCLFWWVGVVWCVGVLVCWRRVVCWCGGGVCGMVCWRVGVMVVDMVCGVWCCVCVSTLQKTHCQDLWYKRVEKMCCKDVLQRRAV